MQGSRVREKGQTSRTETNYGKMIQVPCTFTTSIWRITLKSYFPNCFGAQGNLAFLHVIKVVRLSTSEDGRHANSKLRAEMNHHAFVKLAPLCPSSSRPKSHRPEAAVLPRRTHACCSENVPLQHTVLRKVVKETQCPTTSLQETGLFLLMVSEVRNIQVFVLMKI